MNLNLQSNVRSPPHPTKSMRGVQSSSAQVKVHGMHAHGEQRLGRRSGVQRQVHQHRLTNILRCIAFCLTHQCTVRSFPTAWKVICLLVLTGAHFKNCLQASKEKADVPGCRTKHSAKPTAIQNCSATVHQASPQGWNGIYAGLVGGSLFVQSPLIH